MLALNSVALVTGAARGIGRASALAFARAGADVVLADLHDTDGKIVASEIHQLDRKAVYIRTDIADPESISNLFKNLRGEFGRLDYACNNAGIEGQQAPTADTTLHNFDRVIAVNLRGLFLCLREELKLMSEQGHGAIVNIASIAGLVGFAGLPAYCTSKGGVVQLTRTSALEYAQKNIRINAVCPGAVQTDMIDRITKRDKSTIEQLINLHPMHRFATPEEIAASVIWLCSNDASFITGQALAVDGGLLAR